VDNNNEKISNFKKAVTTPLEAPILDKNTPVLHEAQATTAAVIDAGKKLAAATTDAGKKKTMLATRCNPRIQSKCLKCKPAQNGPGNAGQEVGNDGNRQRIR
jgi:hypothetical protein